MKWGMENRNFICLTVASLTHLTCLMRKEKKKKEQQEHVFLGPSIFHSDHYFGPQSLHHELARSASHDGNSAHINWLTATKHFAVYCTKLGFQTQSQSTSQGFSPNALDLKLDNPCILPEMHI